MVRLPFSTRGSRRMPTPLLTASMPVNVPPPSENARRKTIATHSRAAGRFANTYAISNAREYWAEGVQDWFDANLQAFPADGVHNAVNTRVELMNYDPELAGLIGEVFRDAGHGATARAR